VAVAVIAPIVVVAVLWGLGYLCAIGLIVYMCLRSKRLKQAWYQPGGALYRGPPPTTGGAGQPAMMAGMPPNGSNVQQPMYYLVPGPGTPGGPQHVSPQSTGAVPSSGQYPTRSVSPVSAVPNGQSPPVHNVQPSPETVAPAPVVVEAPVHPKSEAHEMG
jgi:hypothetical protein